MNTNLNHGSARIYQFPAGGRSALGGRRFEEAKRFEQGTDLASPRASDSAGGGACYHDAASQDSKPARER